MSVQSAYQEEQQRLQDALQDIMQQLADIGPRYKGDDFTEQMLDLQQEERRLRLEISRKEPYFGRIDFQELPGDATKALYIGKAGVAKRGSNELLVIDWRAPAASVFYSFTGGDAPAVYVSPEGEISGNVHLKRNFMIRQGEMQRLVDSYVRGQESESVTDEFLLYRLGENKDNKLRDIVSTIQEEQDRIIRADRAKALFIQGVAGSGKTTVALHRLAFLLYQYADRMRAERMIIFAPNRMFLDYISGVLPELGVGDIQQTTFSDWTLALLEHTVKLSDPSLTLAHWFEERRTAADFQQASGVYKGSLLFKALIDARMAEFEQAIVPEQPFEPIDGLVLTSSQMSEWYHTDYGEETLMKKRDRLVSRIRRWFESEMKLRGVSDKKVRAKALAKFNSYTKKIPSYTALELYASLFSGKRAAKDVPKPISTETAARLKQGEAAAEDLAPLAYIQLELYGLTQAPFDHIVIDEAQDYSPLQLVVLSKCQRSASMTVLGDLQQGIHAYVGVNSWQQLTELFEPEQLGYHELNRSYRSTTEIIEFANRILGGMEGEVKPAVPVFRSGDEVALVQVSEMSQLSAIEAEIKDWQASAEFETLAVIGRTAQECDRIHQYLLASGIEASLVQSKQPAYGGGLSVVPVYLSKGLEFDAVLIADAGAEAYTELDAKLLYVGCTRALHKLKLLYLGELTTLIP